jgi:group II intron reverse transcriptase/maturase
MQVENYICKKEEKMKQSTLPMGSDSLFEPVCNPAMLYEAFLAVKRNKGSHGSDGITIQQFEQSLEQELLQLSKELKSWTYKPQPVRKVEIPKPNSTEKRQLGVPCIRDRVVQTAIKMILEPILDPMFSDSSFGFRPNLSQKQAVEQARQQVESGKAFIVDIDLSKFFDRISHDRLIGRLSKVIDDKPILRLIGMTLRSGVIDKGNFTPTKEGTTQGSPLSPLLSNFVLDELDKELEKRGLSFARFADDCNIFLRSRKAADRVMDSISKFITERLKLIINEDKSQVARANRVKFLGMTIIRGHIAISKKALQAAKQKVKELTPRGTNKPLEFTINEFNIWFRGWAGYFDMTHYPAQIKTIEARFRRRIRARIVSQQKRKRHLFNKLKKMKVRPKPAAKAVFSNNRRWHLSHEKVVEQAFSNNWFLQRKMLVRSNDKLPHWFSDKYWVHLT